LKELRDNIHELQKQESTFKKQKDEDHERETKYIINKQNEMAGILIELDVIWIFCRIILTEIYLAKKIRITSKARNVEKVRITF